MNQINVMIVEDELITAKAIAILLKKLNYNPIAIVSTGEDALSRIKDLRVDLILVDIILAGNLDGIETAKIINEQYNIPIVYLTAYGDKKTLDRAKLSEPYGYLVKPITSEDELLPTLELALYNYQVKNKLRKSHKKYEQIKQLIQIEEDNLSSDINKVEKRNYRDEVNEGVDNLFEFEILKEKVNLVKCLKSFSNPERFLILEILKFKPLKLEMIQMLIGKSQSTASHHIKILEKTGFIRGYKNGKYIYYTINKPELMKFAYVWENWLRELSS